MGAIANWLLHEDQKELFDYVFANALNLVFLALTALVLWPLDKATMAFRLAKGYWLFWILMVVTSGVLLMFQRILRMDLYSRFDAYVISSLVLSGFLQAGWSAFAVLLIRNFLADANGWAVVIVYALGVLSCYVASVIVGAFYMGGLYRMVNLALAIVSFIVFSLWPAAGRAIYGWFFDLF
ncbi:MAG TPA: hypothetical protein VNO50_23335 [Pyrinomonadaceae bacterium]|nr:hypothetical protein [Pyrinomonadaceae bacterium]